MSQRARPSSAQTLSDSQRMPMEAAEALLWGKETHNQHTFLFGRMREVEEQNHAYDIRIQAIEAVAEAAEAATSRIRRIEQQIVAIESDEQDRPFDKWAEQEITNFKGFVEKNKTVRQKQIELDKKVSALEDRIDNIKDTPRDIKILLYRIGRLETDRINDASRIRRLEKDLIGLTNMQQAQAVETDTYWAETTQRVTTEHTRPPSLRQQDAEASDAEEETEDEDFATSNPPKPPEKAQIQAFRSPEIIPEKTNRASSLTKGHDTMSARLRMMQRKSIHEPKRLIEDKQQLSRMSAIQPRSRTCSPLGSLPATQIVSRPSACRPTLVEEHASRNPGRLPVQQLIVKLNVRKRKVEENIPSTRVTRSQAKKNNETVRVQATVPAPTAIMASTETQIVNEPRAKRQKPNNARGLPQVRSTGKAGAKDTIEPAPNAANLVKTSPRKATITTKRSKPGGHQRQALTEKLLDSHKKDMTNSTAVTSSRPPVGSINAQYADAGSSSKATSPRKPAMASKTTKGNKPMVTRNTKATGQVPRVS